MRKGLRGIVALIAISVAATAGAERLNVSTTGVNGYDLVSFHQAKKPLRGNGNYVAEYQGVTYLFANEANKQAFQGNPKNYLPAYGGYCAYGIAVGKKFVGDPDVWKIVDGKLYLNLDTSIQDVWNKNVEGNIAKADQNWSKIKDKHPSDL